MLLVAVVPSQELAGEFNAICLRMLCDQTGYSAQGREMKDSLCCGAGRAVSWMSVQAFRSVVQVYIFFKLGSLEVGGKTPCPPPVYHDKVVPDKAAGRINYPQINTQLWGESRAFANCVDTVKGEKGRRDSPGKPGA